ncbi:kinase-like domain-containing protein [Mycena vulgaris]|nr:kinase-like domain-containing protein [Mycena vulgaris]
MYLQPPDVESLNNYRPGGYHPVHLNDSFKAGRYTVVHKLGYGTFATVWLAKDASTGNYVSLKILASKASEWAGHSSEEIEVVSRLQRDSADGRDEDPKEGKAFVMQILDNFEHEGPNGVHQCIVAEVLGPSLAEDTEDLYPSEIFPADIATRFAALGVKFLHNRGVVHADLHLGNLLLYSPEIVAWSSQEDVEEYLGKPQLESLEYRPDTLPPILAPHIPQYYVYMSDPTPLLRLCLNDPTKAQVKICDFSESFIFDSSAAPVQRSINSPVKYRAPEGLLDPQDCYPGPSTDIWALAVLFHMLFTGGCGIFPGLKADQTLREMVILLGKLPEPYWSSSWGNRKLHFDDEGNWVGKAGELPKVSGMFLKLGEETMCDEDRKLFEAMLRSMVVYDPEKRLTAEDVVQSPWFIKCCQSVCG